MVNLSRSESGSPRKDRRPLGDIHNVYQSPSSKYDVERSFDDSDGRFDERDYPRISPKKRRLGASIQISGADLSSGLSEKQTVPKLNLYSEETPTSRLAAAINSDFSSPPAKEKRSLLLKKADDGFQSPRSASKKRKDHNVDQSSNTTVRGAADVRAINSGEKTPNKYTATSAVRVVPKYSVSSPKFTIYSDIDENESKKENISMDCHRNQRVPSNSELGMKEESTALGCGDSEFRTVRDIQEEIRLLLDEANVERLIHSACSATRLVVSEDSMLHWECSSRNVPAVTLSNNPVGLVTTAEDEGKVQNNETVTFEMTEQERDLSDSTTLQKETTHTTAAAGVSDVPYDFILEDIARMKLLTEVDSDLSCSMSPTYLLRATSTESRTYLAAIRANYPYIPALSNDEKEKNNASVAVGDATADNRKQHQINRNVSDEAESITSDKISRYCLDVSLDYSVDTHDTSVMTQEKGSWVREIPKRYSEHTYLSPDSHAPPVTKTHAHTTSHNSRDDTYVPPITQTHTHTTSRNDTYVPPVTRTHTHSTSHNDTYVPPVTQTHTHTTSHNDTYVPPVTQTHTHTTSHTSIEEECNDFDTFRASVKAARDSSLKVLFRDMKGPQSKGRTLVLDSALSFHKSEIDFMTSSTVILRGEVLTPLGTRKSDVTVMRTSRVRTCEKNSHDSISGDLDVRIGGDVTVISSGDDRQAAHTHTNTHALSLSHAHYLTAMVPLPDLHAYQEKVQGWRCKYRTSDPVKSSKQYPSYLPDKKNDRDEEKGGQRGRERDSDNDGDGDKDNDGVTS